MTYVTDEDIRTQNGYQYYYGPSCAIDEPPSWGYNNNDRYYQSKVTSWRGVKNKSIPRTFHRLKFEMSKDIRYDVCGINGNTIKRLHSKHMFHRWVRRAGTISGDPILEVYDASGFNPATEFFNEPKRLTTLKENVRAELFAKANTPQMFDLAPNIAELPETLLFIKNGLKGFAQVTSALRAAKDFLKNPEDAWLTYRYGIMPLILTLTDAIALKGKRIHRKEKYQHYGEDSYLRSGTMIRDFDRKWEWKFRHLNQYNLSCGAGLVVDFQHDPHPFGTGVMDMLRGGWEIVPFSFIIDWFWDVGRWLESLRNTNLVIDSSYITTVLRRDTKAWFDDSSMHWKKPTGDGYCPTFSAPFKMKGYVIDRQVDVLPPQLPVFTDFQLSLNRQIDACALIIGFLKAAFRRR